MLVALFIWTHFRNAIWLCSLISLEWFYQLSTSFCVCVRQGTKTQKNFVRCQLGEFIKSSFGLFVRRVVYSRRIHRSFDDLCPKHWRKMSLTFFTFQVHSYIFLTNLINFSFSFLRIVEMNLKIRFAKDSIQNQFEHKLYRSNEIKWIFLKLIGCFQATAELKTSKIQLFLVQARPLWFFWLFSRKMVSGFFPCFFLLLCFKNVLMLIGKNVSQK